MSEQKKFLDYGAVERALPGTTCLHAVIDAWGLELRVRGPAALLVEYEIITAKMVEIIPPCGYMDIGRDSLKRHALPHFATIRRNKNGELSVYRSLSVGDGLYEAMCKRLGIPDPGFTKPAEDTQWKAPGVQVPMPSNVHRRNVGRFQRPTVWQVLDDKVIFVDWLAIRLDAIAKRSDARGA